MADEKLWEPEFSKLEIHAKLVCDKCVAADNGLGWFKYYVAFAAVLVGAKALQLMAAKILLVPAFAQHFSMILTIWVFSALAGLIVAVRWFWASEQRFWASEQCERRALKERAEALHATVPAWRLQLKTEFLLAYIEDMPPARSPAPASTRIALEAAYFVAVSLLVLLAMAMDLLAAC